jgi:hypothetical protein
MKYKLRDTVKMSDKINSRCITHTCDNCPFSDDGTAEIIGFNGRHIMVQRNGKVCKTCAEYELDFVCAVEPEYIEEISLITKR